MMLLVEWAASVALAPIDDDVSLLDFECCCLLMRYHLLSRRRDWRSLLPWGLMMSRCQRKRGSCCCWCWAAAAIHP